eukprot:GILJ01015394.1.p1 GENE.GILJ01015394.1~~GILJ01015394.1.p1  ORF type:complete len:329 (-),score=46.22 GILJ01015394.1:393-1340(-)
METSAQQQSASRANLFCCAWCKTFVAVSEHMAPSKCEGYSFLTQMTNVKVGEAKFLAWKQQFAGVGESDKDISCEACNRLLGYQQKDAFVVKSERVKERDGVLRVSVYGFKAPDLKVIQQTLENLKLEDHSFNMALSIPSPSAEESDGTSTVQLPLSDRSPPVVHCGVLLKSALRGFQVKEDADLIILTHKNEGRVFLTDRNGFYNDFLLSAWKKTAGHVLILLTNSATADESLTNQQLTTLSTQGEQPTLGILARHGKVLTLASELSTRQLQHLKQLLVDAYLRSPVKLEDLPSAYQEALQRKAENAGLRCSLL